MKTCFKCNQSKPFTEFYKHSAMGDGYLNKCKECTKVDVRINRRKNQEYYRAYDRARGNRWRDGYEADYRKRFPDKYYAQKTLGNAVRDGKVKKEVCFICGDEKVEAHHPDYSKPLDVIWLCPGHHKLIHAYENKANEIRGSI